MPSERGRWARPSGDNPRFLNGMLYVLRTGCPWRDMHERYGKWNSVYVRFRIWSTVLWSAPIPRQRVQKGGSYERFWSLTRRLYEQNPRPVRQSRTSFRLCP
ncbi:transposase [Gluconobacter sphaericus]|uniref:transposase n=1 Tax=Gluconobacter sphaericus TaxID=574987 RepID=UPI0038D05DD8